MDGMPYTQHDLTKAVEVFLQRKNPKIIMTARVPMKIQSQKNQKSIREYKNILTS